MVSIRVFLLKSRAFIRYYRIIVISILYFLTLGMISFAAYTIYKEMTKEISVSTPEEKYEVCKKSNLMSYKEFSNTMDFFSVNDCIHLKSVSEYEGSSSEDGHNYQINHEIPTIKLSIDFYGSYLECINMLNKFNHEGIFWTNVELNVIYNNSCHLIADLEVICTQKKSDLKQNEDIKCKNITQNGKYEVSETKNNITMLSRNQNGEKYAIIDGKIYTTNDFLDKDNQIVHISRKFILIKKKDKYLISFPNVNLNK